MRRRHAELAQEALLPQPAPADDATATEVGQEAPEVFGPAPEAPAGPADEAGTPASETAKVADPEAERPPLSGKGSGIEAWVAYALAQGKPEAKLDGLSRDQLAALFE